MLLAARMLTFGSAFILALPPGWCCFALNVLVAASAPNDEVEPPIHACCRVPAPSGAPCVPAEGDESSPAKPATACCCQQEPAQPKDSDAAPDALPCLAELPAAPPSVLATRAESGGTAASDRSVSLQVLHCLWLC